MNRYYRKLSFFLILGAIALLGYDLPTHAQAVTSKQETTTETKTFYRPILASETSSLHCLNNEEASQRIQLFYYRQATKIATVLKAIPSLECLVIANYSEDSIILNGPKKLSRKLTVISVHINSSINPYFCLVTYSRDTCEMRHLSSNFIGIFLYDCK